MENILAYLTDLDSQALGKRKLLLIFYALSSKSTSNDVIFDYLSAIVNNFPNNNHFLHVIPFKYQGSVQRVIHLKAYMEHNTKEKPTLKKKITDYHNIPEVDLKFLFDQTEIDSNSMLSNSNHTFIWLAKAQHDKVYTTDLAYKLGLCYPNETLVAIKPNLNEYELYLPTFIEAGENNNWFYPNPNANATWGRTVSIDDIMQNATEADIGGLPEALSKPIQLSKESTAAFLGKMNNSIYFNNKLNLLNRLIENNFYDPAMKNSIIATYQSLP